MLINPRLRLETSILMMPCSYHSRYCMMRLWRTTFEYSEEISPRSERYPALYPASLLAADNKSIHFPFLEFDIGHATMTISRYMVFSLRQWLFFDLTRSLRRPRSLGTLSMTSATVRRRIGAFVA
jgi:hypothetical protein